MVASTSSATQLTQSADIFGGTLSSPDSLKNGSNAAGADKSRDASGASASMVEDFGKAIASLPVVSVNSIGAGIQGLNSAPAQPYYGNPQAPYGQVPYGQTPYAPAQAPAANAAPATNAAPQSGGMTVSIGKKKEDAPPAGAKPDATAKPADPKQPGTMITA